MIFILFRFYCCVGRMRRVGLVAVTKTGPNRYSTCVFFLLVFLLFKCAFSFYIQLFSSIYTFTTTKDHNHDQTTHDDHTSYHKPDQPPPQLNDEGCDEDEQQGDEQWQQGARGATHLEPEVCFSSFFLSKNSIIDHLSTGRLCVHQHQHHWHTPHTQRLLTPANPNTIIKTTDRNHMNTRKGSESFPFFL